MGAPTKPPLGAGHHRTGSSRAGRPDWRRRALDTGVSLSAVLALVLTSCSEGPSATSAGPTASGVSTEPTGAGDTAPATAANRSTTTTSPATSALAYPSAIVDETIDDPRFTRLEQDITRRISAADLPGASLLVLHDGELVQQEAFGSYDLATRVPIASASKWLAGATIMSVVEDGSIELDEPIRTYLPAARGPVGTITMRQLVAFTSGLQDDEEIPCFSDGAKTLAECNDEILGLGLLGAPGTGYRYTGTHLHLAAGVVEAVTGQTWEEVFQERIGRPLVMDATSFIGGRRPTSAADGHPAPSGSASSTLGDYGRFLEMLVHDGVAPTGERILSAGSVAAMATDQTGAARFVSGPPDRMQAQTPYGVAHWLDVVDADGRAVVESSPGAFGFRPWIDHQNGIAGVYLVEDHDDDRVADAPGRSGPAPADVQTSGQFVVIGSIQALDGRLPAGLR